MGLKGNLAEVKLADIFKMLSESSTTGLLRVQGPEGPRYVEIQNGVISIAGRSTEHIKLGNLLFSRGLVDEPKLEQALQAQQESGKLLGQVLIDLGLLSLADLQQALQFQVEEEVHELFMLRDGEFDFLANATLDAKLALAGGLVRLKIDPNALLAEALRRAGEWSEIEQRITSQALLFQLTPAGQETLQSGEGVSWEGAVLLKLIHAQRTVESMVRKGCLGRLATNQMLIELWNAGLIAPLPLAEYEKVAREHLHIKRWEEARRVAGYALAHSGGAQEKLFQALLNDIGQERGLEQSTPTRLATDPKIRADLIRRSTPNLIVAREYSAWLLVAGALLLVLAGGGAAAYFYLGRGARNLTTTAFKALEQDKAAAHQLSLESRWQEALAKLRDFKTSDAEVRKLASEYLKKVQDDFERELLKTIDEFYKLYPDGPPGELKDAADKLEPMLGVEAVSPGVISLRDNAREILEKYRGQLKTAQLQRELKTIQNSPEAKAQNCEALEKNYLALLAKQPPEELAVIVREEARKLYALRKQAAAILKKARELEKLGDTEGARIEFERVGKLYPLSSLAKQAQTALTQLAEANAPFQRRLKEIREQVSELRHDEARQELLKFLNESPPQEFAAQALSLLHTLSDTESDLAAVLSEAAALAEKQPREARQKILGLLAKHPYAKALGNAALKVAVQSDPPGAEVLLDNESAGSTPLTLDLPAAGRFTLAFRKAGFDTPPFSGYNFRADTLRVILNRLPVATRRLPAPAQGGLAVLEGWLVAAGGGELTVCECAGLKVETRIPLPGGTGFAPQPGKAAPPAFLSMDNSQALVSMGKLVLQVRLPHGETERIDLDEAATSAPVAFAPPPNAENRRLGLATRGGYECYDTADNKRLAHATFGGAAQEPVYGLAGDGNIFYIPRPNGVWAIAAETGKKRWQGNSAARLSGPPAWHSASGTVAAADVNGHLTVFDAGKGTLCFQSELKAESVAGGYSALDDQTGKVQVIKMDGSSVGGCAALGDGFLVLLSSGHAVLCSATEDKVLWSVALAGEPVLPPLVLGPAPGAGDKAVVCTARNDEYFVCLLSAQGALLWRAPLYARAIGVASDGKQVFVSTEDADLVVFDLQ